MAGRYAPSDDRFMHDLWHATSPGSDEHRLAFTLKLTSEESARLRRQGSSYLTEALRTVRDFLRAENPLDTVIIVVERNKVPSRDSYSASVDLHIHGWIRIEKTVSASALQKRLTKNANNKTQKKICADRGVVIQDINRRTGKAVDSGWVRYLRKDFNRWPTGCTPASHRFSASQPTKSKARDIGQHPVRKFRQLKRAFRIENAQIRRREGEWKYHHLAYDPNDPAEHEIDTECQ